MSQRKQVQEGEKLLEKSLHYGTHLHLHKYFQTLMTSMCAVENNPGRDTLDKMI